MLELIPRLAASAAFLAICFCTVGDSFGEPTGSEVVTTTDGRQILLRADGTYEVVTSSHSTAAGEFQDMSIVDLKLDISQLDGTSVEVTGAIMMFGGMAMLSDPRQPFDTNPIPIDVDGLPRDDREFLISRCGTSCRVTVQGEVGTVFFQPGIVARSLTR